jgi:hypothetical protein
MTTYVYDNVEVRKTGRDAHRIIKTSPGGSGRILCLVEITPVKDFDWVKWVAPDQLYEVKEPK